MTPECSTPKAQSRLAVYALTSRGLDLASRIAAACGADVFAASSLRLAAEEGNNAPVWFTRLAQSVRENFTGYNGHIFVAATGIAVRSIAPLLASKTCDPAVLVVDQRGSFVISLLSGHLGGANTLARDIAKAIGAVPVITTATDVEGLPAIDSLAKERGLAIGDPSAIKTVHAALLAGDPVALHDPENRLGLHGSVWEALFILMPTVPESLDAPHLPAVVVTENVMPQHPRLLALHPRTLCAGIGCRKGTPAAVIEQHVRDRFAAAGLCLASLACLASATVKQDEPGLHEAARNLGVPLRFFSPDVLGKFPVSVQSPKAMSAFGLKGVCEPAALASAYIETDSDTAPQREGAEQPIRENDMPLLLVSKCVGEGVTLAVAKSALTKEGKKV